MGVRIQLFTLANKMAAQTILVVEDHALVRDTVIRTLMSAGYQVLSAASGEEALTLISATGHSIDLLVCDVLLPGISGTELARQIGGHCPGIRCLFISGLPEHPRVLREIVDYGLNLLPKPFLPHALIGKVRELLGDRPRVLTASV
jgi:two-component system cell cycle sensor histidine kinase/response regulator CckA